MPQCIIIIIIIIIIGCNDVLNVLCICWRYVANVYKIARYSQFQDRTCGFLVR